MQALQKFQCSLLLVVLIQTADAQNTINSIKTILTADSVASGNLKDVLTSFFQLSYDKLTGPDKEFNFSSNPYAFLLKTNPDAAIDVNYQKYRFMRKLNFGFGIKLDTSYKFNGFSSVIKYALIDQRDATTSKMLFHSLGTDSLSLEINSLQIILTQYIISNFPNDTANKPGTRRFYIDQLTKMFTDSVVAFNGLDTDFQTMVKKLAADSNLVVFSRLIKTNPDVNILKESQLTFAELKQELKNKLLWTVSLSDTTNNNSFFFSNIVLKTELLKGMSKKLKPGSNWELNMQAALKFTDDTSINRRNLKRAVFSFEPGFNWVIRARNYDLSFLELMFSGEYHHILSGLYQNEEKNFFTFNSVLRLRLFRDVWIPIEIKYDPKHGNLFGLINAKFNFSLLKKAG